MQTIEMRGTSYNIRRRTRLPFARAIERVTEALGEEGFGVLTTIDVQATLAKKIQAEFAPYVILGACNPTLARKVLSTEPDVGLLLPCNVVVSQAPDGVVEVSALKPSVVFERLVEAPGLVDVACDAEERLTRALDAVARSA